MVELNPAVTEWLTSQLEVVNVTGHRARAWAEVWRIEAVDGVWWLKVNKAGTVYEPRLLELLGGLQHSLVPPASVHPSEPWSLVADAGTSARERLAGAGSTEVIAFWSDLLAEYAELQRSVPVDRLLRIGVPDFRPEQLADRFDDLLRHREWFRVPAVGLDDDARARFAALRPRLVAAADELAAGVPSGLQHDDLHDGNVMLPHGCASGPGGHAAARPRVIDWGDAVVAHPFATLRLTLGSLAEDLGAERAGPGLERVTSAYLEGWRTGGRSEAELRRQLELATWLECVIRAAGWIRALGTVEVGRRTGFAGSPAGWLTRMDQERPAPARPAP